MRWKSSQPALAKQVASDEARLMPAPPRWLLAVPDAIRQLEALDRDLLTRRDVERLFGVSRARAAQLMPMFGAELVGASRVLRRSELLRQLRKYRARAAYRGEEVRRTRLVAELRTARLTGIKRRAAAAELPASTCCHTFRATGITAYLSNGGTLEHAQRIAGHASPKTTKLYDRTADTITLDEIERIVI